jgi:hypothetical protein
MRRIVRSRTSVVKEVSANPQTRAFAELLIDCEEDRTLRAVLVGMLREADRNAWAHTRHEDEGVCLARASGRAHSLL